MELHGFIFLGLRCSSLDNCNLHFGNFLDFDCSHCCIKDFVKMVMSQQFCVEDLEIKRFDFKDLLKFNYSIDSFHFDIQRP